MMPVNIDFAPASLRRSLWRCPPAYYLLAATGLVLCLSAALAISTTRAQKAREQRQQAYQTQLRNQRANAAAPRPPAPISPARASAVNNAVWQLNLPWQELQEAIEEASSAKAPKPGAVALLSLEPDARSHSIRITAESKNSDDMLAYIERLKQQTFFSTVTLSKHDINEQDSNKPLRFQLDVQWLASAATATP